MALTTRFLMSALVILGTVTHSHGQVVTQVAVVQLRDACSGLNEQALESGANCDYRAVPNAKCEVAFVDFEEWTCVEELYDNETTLICKCPIDNTVCPIDNTVINGCVTNALGVCKMDSPSADYDGFAIICVDPDPGTGFTSITNNKYKPYAYLGPLDNKFTYAAIWTWNYNGASDQTQWNNNGKKDSQAVGEVVLPCGP